MNGGYCIGADLLVGVFWAESVPPLIGGKGNLVRLCCTHKYDTGEASDTIPTYLGRGIELKASLCPKGCTI